MIANTMSHSYPTIANSFARVPCSQLALKCLSISFQASNGDLDCPHSELDRSSSRTERRWDPVV
jgi:hypothetical protein